MSAAVQQMPVSLLSTKSQLAVAYLGLPGYHLVHTAKNFYTLLGVAAAKRQALYAIRLHAALSTMWRTMPT